MKTLIMEVEDKKNSISNFFNFLEKLDMNDLTIHSNNMNENSLYKLPIGISTVQKSSCILMLYNFIESLTTILIAKIHNEIIDKNIIFFKLNYDIRNTIIMYYSNVVEKNNVKNSAPHIQDVFLLLSNNKKMKITYEDLSKFYSLYSGNLDAREIKKVFEHYGIKILTAEPGLKTIREGRNKLAHGEHTFEEYGRTLTIQQLIALKTSVFEYFDNLILKVKQFIEDQQYLEANHSEE